MGTQVELLDSTPKNHVHPSSRHRDPHSHNDDPLLGDLLILCSLHGRLASRSTLSNGLPLGSDRFALSILPRTAAGVGLEARVVMRSLDKIPMMSLPAVSLLNSRGTEVLPAWNDDDSVCLVPSKSEDGETCVDAAVFEQNYMNKIIFAYPRHGFDLQAEAFLPRIKS